MGGDLKHEKKEADTRQHSVAEALIPAARRMENITQGQR